MAEEVEVKISLSIEASKATVRNKKRVKKLVEKRDLRIRQEALAKLTDQEKKVLIRFADSCRYCVYCDRDKTYCNWHDLLILDSLVCDAFEKSSVVAKDQEVLLNIFRVNE